MTSSTPNAGRSRGRAAIYPAATAAILLLAACDKKADNAPAADATPASAPAVAAGATTPKTTLKAAAVKSAYAAEFNDNSKMTDPTEKKVSAFVAKVGKAASDTGRKQTWLALDGDKCVKLELDTKDGSLTDMTTSNADCGI